MPLSHQIPIFENIAAALLYTPIFIIASMLFHFIKTKHTISFQRDLYISLAVQAFLRIVLNGFEAFEKGIDAAKLDNIFGKQYYYIKLLNVGFEMIGTYVSFSVYLTLAAFWAEQYYEHLINRASDSNEAYINNRDRIKKKISIVYWIITLTTYAMIVAILIIYYIMQNDFVYQLMRLIMRLCFTLLIVILVLYFGIRFYIVHKKAYASIPDTRLTRVLLLSLVCSLMFITLSVHNTVSFIFYEEYHESGYRWLFFLLAVLIECTSHSLLLFCMRPLTWCQQRPRSIWGWCVKIIKGQSTVKEISFQQDPMMDAPDDDDDEELKHLTLTHETTVILPVEDDENSSEW